MTYRVRQEFVLRTDVHLADPDGEERGTIEIEITVTDRLLAALADPAEPGALDALREAWTGARGLVDELGRELQWSSAIRERLWSRPWIAAAVARAIGGALGNFSDDSPGA